MSHLIMDNLRELAKKAPQIIAFPEAENELILLAARQALDLGIGIPLLICAPKKVRKAAKKAGVSLKDFEIFDNTDENLLFLLAERYTAKLAGLNTESIVSKAKDPLNCAMLLCKLGEADCVAAGRQYTTAEVFRSALSIIGLRPGIETVSSLGILNIPGFSGPEGSLLALADCAVNPCPGASALADIAICSAATVRRLLGWEPRVAMLSFSTCGSARHESINVITEAIRLARLREPALKIDGEFQLDAAILPEIARIKMNRESEVAGKANVLVVPNLHAGNIGVKMMQIFANTDAYGPIFQGFSKPICDFSRSAPLSEMMGNIIMLAVTASRYKEVLN